MKTIMLGGLVVWAILAVIAGVVAITHQPRHGEPHAVCLQSHREVVLIPTVCDRSDDGHDICQRAIVTDVCDRIQASAPIRQSDYQ